MIIADHNVDYQSLIKMNSKCKKCWIIILMVALEIPWISKCKLLDNYKFPVFTTGSCPKNQQEWNNGSKYLNCTEKNGYICIPNKQRTMLLHFCYTAPRIPIEKDACLVMDMISSTTDIYSCNNFENGCPNIAYFSNQIYKYQSCLLIGHGCFLSEKSCSILRSTTDIQRTSDDFENYLKFSSTTASSTQLNTTDFVYTTKNRTKACILLFVFTALVLMAVCTIMTGCIIWRKKYGGICFSSRRKENDIERDYVKDMEETMLPKDNKVDYEITEYNPESEALTARANGAITINEEFRKMEQRIISAVPCSRLPELTFSGIEVKGDNVQLTYRVSASFHSTWKKDGKEITTSEKYTIEKNVEEHSLTINTISKEDQGQYQYTIADENASDKYQVELRPPRIKDVHVCTQGKAVKLKCLIEVPEECKDITSIRWMKDGLPLSDEERFSHGGIEDPSLIIQNPDESDRGNWQVVVSNVFGDDERIIYVGPAKVKELHICTQGDAVKLKCSIEVPEECKGITSIKWMKDGLPPSGKEKFSHGGIEDPSLIIQNPDESDRGNWQVVVSNVFGGDDEMLQLGCLKTPNKRIKVFLATGEFSEIQVDAIITFSGHNLNMNVHTVNEALEEKFGEEIERTIEKNYARGLSPSQVADISTENHCCKRIYVGVLPEYTSEIFQKIIVNCLHMSTGRGMESLCIPCFGDKTQFLIAAEKAVEAIMKYDEILSGTTVKIFYIFVEKEENLQLYNEIKYQIFGKSPTKTIILQDTEEGANSRGMLPGGEMNEEQFCLWTESQIKLGKQDFEFIIKDISVILLQDDITNVEAGALLNSSNERLDLRWGHVSRAILRKCSPEIDKECSKRCEEMRENKIVVTPGCGLNVKCIIHVDCPMTVFDWIERLQMALTKASDHDCSSLSMPLIGTESFIPFAVETMCEVILVSISKFKRRHSNSPLEQVKIVAFEERTYNQVLLFLKKCSKHK